MQCENPILIKERNKDIPSAKRDFIRVPCGRCFACQMNKARDWSFRIMNETRLHDESIFVTLTYNEEHLPRVSDMQGTLVKSDLQNFMKRLRKAISPRKIRFFACGEYGEKYVRPHYHLIIFGLGPTTLQQFPALLERCWPFGFVSVGSVTYGSASYVARYTTKLLTGDKKKLYKEYNIQPEFALMSRRPGIGVPFLPNVLDFAKSHKFLRSGQFKMSIPRLYRTKIWQTEEDKRELQSYMRDVARKVSEQLAKDYGLDWYAVRGSTKACKDAEVAISVAKKRLAYNRKNPI